MAKTAIDIWHFILLDFQFLKVATEIQEFHKALVVLDAAVQFKPYSESKNYRLELDYYLTTTCLVAGEHSKAFDSFRVLFSHETEENKSRHTVWDLFNMIVRWAIFNGTVMVLSMVSYRNRLKSFFKDVVKYTPSLQD